MRHTQSMIRKSTLPTLAVLLSASLGLLAGPASAASITCSHVNEICQGTNDYDAITGWNNNNQIYAKSGRDDIWAYPGQDTINAENDGDNANGGEGADYIYGGYGNDSYLEIGGNAGLFGGTQADHIEGNVGRDFLEGNAGGDGMYGGDSADTFFAEDATADIVNGQGWESPYTQPCYVDGYDAWSNCEPH